MRILFIRKSVLGNPGMASVNFFPIMLSRLNHDVSIIGLNGDNDVYRNSTVKVKFLNNNLLWHYNIYKYIRLNKPDIVNVYYHNGCGLIPFICFFTNSKFILDIRSPLLKVGFKRFLIRIKNYFEPLFFDEIFSHNQHSATTLIGNKKVITVPPGFDKDILLKNKKIISKKPSFVYIGSVNPKRNINRVINAFGKAININKKITLTIYSNDEDNSELIFLIKKLELSKNIKIHKKIPNAKLQSKLSHFTYGLSYIPIDLYNFAPPLKTIEYLAAGLTVLATNTDGN